MKHLTGILVFLTAASLPIIAARPTRAQTESLTGFTYTLPTGWQEDKKEEGITLTGVMKTGRDNTVATLLVATGGAVENTGNPDALTTDIWQKLVLTIFAPSSSSASATPPVYRRYVGNGMRCFFAYESQMRLKNGGSFPIGNDIRMEQIAVSLYVVEVGKRLYPLVVMHLCQFSKDREDAHTTLLEPLLKSFKAPAGAQKKPLLTKADVVGSWRKSTASPTGSLVTSGGTYVGTSGSATEIVYTFRPDGTYSSDGAMYFRNTFGSKMFTGKNTGTWHIEGGNILVVKGKKEGSGGRFPFLGVSRKDGVRTLILAGDDKPRQLSMDAILYNYGPYVEVKK